MAKMGRPKIPIDRKQFESLCGLQCTKEEIASFFDCSVDTIENWCHSEYDSTFSAVFKQKRDVGKVSLRRSQFRMAQKNATMAIWLGKQYLGQSDKQEVVVSKEDESIKEMDRYFSKKKKESTAED